MLSRNYSKPFSIAGLIFGEIYMLLMLLAPRRMGVENLQIPFNADPPIPANAPIPLDALLTRILVYGIFLGVFGALVGLGIGLLFSGLVSRLKKK